MSIAAACRQMPRELLVSVAARNGWEMLQTWMTRRPSLPQRLVALLGPMSNARSHAIARRILIAEFKNRSLWSSWWHGGLRYTSRLVRPPKSKLLVDLHLAKKPAILAFMHIGARFALGPALFRQEIPALVLVTNPYRSQQEAPPIADSLEGIEFLQLQENTTRGFFLAVQRLRQGGTVAIGIDGKSVDRSLEIPFLGRPFPLGRGCAAMARLTGAPIIPVATLWRAGMSIALEMGEPMDVPRVPGEDAEAADRQVMASLAGWFERLVRARPGQLRPKLVEELLGSPPPGLR